MRVLPIFRVEGGRPSATGPDDGERGTEGEQAAVSGVSGGRVRVVVAVAGSRRRADGQKGAGSAAEAGRGRGSLGRGAVSSGAKPTATVAGCAARRSATVRMSQDVVQKGGRGHPKPATSAGRRPSTFLVVDWFGTPSDRCRSCPVLSMNEDAGVTRAGIRGPISLTPREQRFLPLAGAICLSTGGDRGASETGRGKGLGTRRFPLCDQATDRA